MRLFAYDHFNFRFIQSCVPISGILQNYLHWTEKSLEPGVPAIHIQRTPLKTVEFALLQDLHYTHHFTNRKAVYYGPTSYSYANTSHSSSPIPTSGILSEIFNYTNYLFNNHFNSFMIHFYCNELSHMPRHSDNEKYIEENSLILSLSYGDSRKFNVFNKNNELEKFSFMLEHGDFLLMSSASQKDFKHELPIDKIKKSPRISITFRKMRVE